MSRPGGPAMKPLLLLALVVTALAAMAGSAAAATISISGGGNVPESATAHVTITTAWSAGESEPLFNRSLTGNTATAGADFGDLTPTSTGSPNCTLGGCNRQYSYDVPIVNDNIDEPDETFTATVTSSGLAPSSTTFTIGDDDPTPTVSINDKPVGEADGIAHFTASLSNPSSQAIDVPWTTANGTALAPGDFTASTNTAHF